MVDYLDQIKTIALTALFNPAFLGLLAILFLVGRYFEKLTKRLTWWKLLIVGYFAIFLYQPVRDAGLIIGGVFIAGMLSNHVSSFGPIFSGGANLWDVLASRRYHRMYEDIRRKERELEEREQRLREAERARAYQDREDFERARAGWQHEARGFRNQSARGQNTNGEEQKRFEGHKWTAHESKTTTSQDEVVAGHLLRLGLKPGRSYSHAEIKRAFRRSAKAAHPDVGGTEQAFIDVSESYAYLRRIFS